MIVRFEDKNLEREFKNCIKERGFTIKSVITSFMKAFVTKPDDLIRVLFS